METIRLSTKGQLVIPNEIRKAHQLVPGTNFIVSFVGREIRLTPVPPFPQVTAVEAAGLLARRGRKAAADKTTRAKIQRSLKARDAATRS